VLFVNTIIKQSDDVRFSFFGIRLAVTNRCCKKCVVAKTENKMR